MVMSIQHKVPGSSKVGWGSVDQNLGARASLMITLLFAADTTDLENPLIFFPRLPGLEQIFIREKDRD